MRLDSLESRIDKRGSRDPYNEKAHADSAHQSATRAQNSCTANMMQRDLEQKWVKMETMH